MDIAKYEEFLSSNRATQKILLGKQKKYGGSLKDFQNRLSDLLEALKVMNATGVLSQKRYKDVIEELVTNALQFIFGDGYSFEIESTVSRNQPEDHLYVVQDGERYLLTDDEIGFGVIDIVSLALRVVCWAIHHTRTDKVFWLDEPLKNLDNDRFESVDHMLHQLSKMLGLQFIIVTQRSGLAVIGDKSFLVERKKKVSSVTLLHEREKAND